MNTTGYMQTVQQPNPPKCECHECTQVRWKMSIQGQVSSAIPGSQFNVPNHQGPVITT